MTDIELPALRGDDALGFLAAIGVLRLCVDELGDSQAQLGWPNGPSNAATISVSNCDSLAGLATRLFAIAHAMKQQNQLLPGVAGFPRGAGKTEETADPMRSLTLRDGRGLSENALDATGPPHLAAWVQGLICTSVLVSDKSEDVLQRSRFFGAGPGTVWMARTIDKSLDAVKTELAIDRALTMWRRVDQVGAYLDHRADRDAAGGQDPRKTLPKYGEPGATWLALMGLPMFPVRARSQTAVETVGWSQQARPKAKRFSWPVWSSRLDINSVRALLDHPAIGRLAEGSGAASSLAALGVWGVYRSERLSASNNDGALGPAKLVLAASPATTVGN